MEAAFFALLPFNCEDFLGQFHHNPLQFLFYLVNLHRKNIFHPKSYLIMAYVITDACVACGTCLPECPVEAISEGEIYKIDPDTCIECGSCAAVCPNDAILPPA